MKSPSRNRRGARLGALLLVAASPLVISWSVRAGAETSDGDEMIDVPGGHFVMGNATGHYDETTTHDVVVSAFHIDRYEVTNRAFARFVEATGHVTDAEKEGYSWCYLEGESDFTAVSGADWLHPEGPGSSIDERWDHPVVCVSWNDAAAYTAWAGKRLPTEAEWEFASRAGSEAHFKADTGEPPVVPMLAEASGHEGRGGTHHQLHADHAASVDASPDAVTPHPSSRHHASGHAGQIATTGEIIVAANVWQGTWPTENRLSDGFYYTAPVGSFAPNAYGVHDMIGNVWEWTADWYAADYYDVSPVDDPVGPETGELRVARGGSWFCSANYCGAYTTHYRGSSPAGSAFNNVGFRCAADAVRDEKIESES